MLRVHKSFNRDWLFMLGDDPERSLPDHDDRGWRRLNVPHDWSNDYPLDEHNSTCGGGGYALAGIGWYRKHFDYEEEFENRIVSLTFDGVYMDSTVWLNGIEVGGNRYGYSSFSVDITKALRRGDNVLAVRVDNSVQPNSRWYTGSGIYRNVWLDAKAPVRAVQLGTFFRVISLDEPSASLLISTEVENGLDRAANVGVIQTLRDGDGNTVLTEGTALTLGAGERGTAEVSPKLERAHLWTDKDPYLYTLTTVVTADGEKVDAITMRVGIRTATFDADRGFLLNGNTVKIKGMCLHHDCGLTGAVGYRDTWERRLRALKDMGCNGIRCAHNPPSVELLDLCDELGFLVMDEAFDEWFITKGKGGSQVNYGSSRFFEECSEQILVNMLRRDRNHPSVVLWSIGNEIPEQGSQRGVEIARTLTSICHREDPSRMVTSACDCIAATYGATLHEFEEALDVVGYNYVDRWRERAETQYDGDRKLFPERRFIGSENASAGGERGIYVPREGVRPDRAEYTIWSHHHEWLWRYMVSRDFVAGDYLWTGVDYLGECRWPRRGSSSAPIDSAGFPKDTYYYFRSIWNTEQTTLHILPHWNWQGDEGQYKQVIIYTNCDKVDLYINDRKVGTKACGAPYYGASRNWNDRPRKVTTTHDLHLSFDVMYEPGTLRAVGYKDGEAVIEEAVMTAGEPTALTASADRTLMKVDTAAHIDISTIDSKGRHVPTATPMISCEIVSGPARLVGMDGGDMYDTSLYSNRERRMFSGRLMAMIYADAPGDIVVKIGSEGMEPVYVNIKAE